MNFPSDAFERLTATALQAFLSVFIITDLGTAEAGLIDAAAAALSLIKSWLARTTGTAGTASLAD